ncbi:hypothetical protein [Proteiniborus sp.]|uniref:hypothetical protein n=1 Tax=Proteiniborus sp. TaxID=2079015 RepID=UPI0033252714
MRENTSNEFEHCTAFCPLCGTDLYFLDGECYCKNSTCNWSCGGCARFKELIFNDKGKEESH